MSRAALPEEFELYEGDRPVMVRFDYDLGEEQWFDARAGVGSPGYPPSLEITEINAGDGWELPSDKFDLASLESQLANAICKLEEAQSAAEAEAEYQHWKEMQELFKEEA